VTRVGDYSLLAKGPVAGANACLRLRETVQAYEDMVANPAAREHTVESVHTASS